MSPARRPKPPAGPGESGVAEREGVRIAWRSHGAGEPVLMIMGLMGSGYAWFRLLPHIASDRRAIVFDNRGTGDSDRPRGLWSMRTFADDAIAVMNAAGVERAHVIGASMGGMIAQHVALDHPDRVRSLTLACTTAGGSRGNPPWRLFASMAARPLVGIERTFPIVAPLLYSEATRADPKKLADDLALRASDATPLATAPGQFSAIARHDTRKRLGELEMPVLVLHGEEDKLVPPAAGGKLAERIPDARLVTLPGTGHVLTTDDEEGTAGAIREFLDEVEEAEEPASEAGLRGVARR